MEKSSKNKLIGVGILSVLTIGGVLLWRFLRNPTSNINQSTVNFTHSKQQAANLYAWFGVTRVNGVAFVPGITVLQKTLNLIAWLAANIDDWQVVQETFTDLCGGNYTVFEAAKSALSTNNFGVFSSLITDALKKKRIICNTANGITLKNANRYGGVAAEQFVKDDFVGRCQNTDDYYYYYISEKDGNTYAAPKKDFKLV